ncbi:MAG TPA: hypothetical protein VGC34_03795 [Steroidobacteraceae bacterium]
MQKQTTATAKAKAASSPKRVQGLTRIKPCAGAHPPGCGALTRVRLADYPGMSWQKQKQKPARSARRSSSIQKPTLAPSDERANPLDHAGNAHHRIRNVRADATTKDAARKICINTRRTKAKTMLSVMHNTTSKNYCPRKSGQHCQTRVFIG